MPSYPYLFELKAKADQGEIEVKLPPGAAPAGQVVVARPDAIDLVRYLQALDRSYPAAPAPETKEAKP